MLFLFGLVLEIREAKIFFNKNYLRQIECLRKTAEKIYQSVLVFIGILFLCLNPLNPAR